ncbi:aquaporin [Cellulomonas sp. JH27-2]|uniref:aquaporin n=1 Tax=Cellulomonas sp. JH27-2 TaxID=2774139 RepID=UPI00177EB229|nr:aquaporin [Cellulomonas sp. JH27-2]MBD8060269.1 aquaporin [Cellulomonas sp. JH27-2]
MSQTPDPVAGSPEPEEVTAAAAADATASDATNADSAAPAATQPDATPEPPTFAKPDAAPAAAAPVVDDEEADVTVEEIDAYVVPAGTAIVTGPSLVARLGAEVFGTFFLVLAGLGVALYASSTFAATGGGAGGLGVALAFGIAVAGGAAAVGYVSGGHFNPAVTFGAALAGRTSWRDVVPYWVAQLVGGAIAAAVLFISVPSKLPGAVAQDGKGSVRNFFSAVANGFGEHSPLGTGSQGAVQFSLLQALLIEAVVTAVFVGVILGVTDRRSKSVVGPFAIGLTLAVLILIAMPVTNASLNPARSTAAAIFSEGWAFKQLWLFWVAPLLGGAIAGLIYRAFAAEPADDNLLGEDDVYVTDEDVLVVNERQA